VVEAVRRSGSLITARFANEQGREVFAVPGSPLDPRADGPNQLLRQGATICLSAANVIEALTPMREGRGAPEFDFDDPGQASSGEEDLWDETDLFGATGTPRTMAGMAFDDAGSVIAGDVGVVAEAPPGLAPQPGIIESLMGATPVTIDELVRQSGLPVPEVKMIILDLEIAGRIERHGGDLISLLPCREGSEG
jgi:DNA processing protein